MMNMRETQKPPRAVSILNVMLFLKVLENFLTTSKGEMLLAKIFKGIFELTMTKKVSEKGYIDI